MWTCIFPKWHAGTMVWRTIVVGFVTALFVDSVLTGTLACVDELRLLLHVCGDGLCYGG